MRILYMDYRNYHLKKWQLKRHVTLGLSHIKSWQLFLSSLISNDFSWLFNFISFPHIHIIDTYINIKIVTIRAIISLIYAVTKFALQHIAIYGVATLSLQYIAIYGHDNLNLFHAVISDAYRSKHLFIVRAWVKRHWCNMVKIKGI